MAHGTRVNNTAYGIAGGKCLVNGTSYSIQGGKTLVNGTSYSIQGGKTLVNGTGYDIAFFDGYKIVVTHSDSNQIQDTSAVELRINGTSEMGYDGEVIMIIDFDTLAVTTGTFYGTGVCQLAALLPRGELYINGTREQNGYVEYYYTITTNVTIDVTYSTRVGVVLRITEQ